MLFYLVSLVVGFVGVHMPLMHGSGPISIVFSLVVTAVAALNLVPDFDVIETARPKARPSTWSGTGPSCSS